MLLLVDVGNTNTRVGLWEGGEVGRLDVSPTALLADATAVSALVERIAGAGPDEMSVAFCSGVPAAQELWRAVVADLFVVRGDTPAPVENGYREPARLGADRLAGAVGAVRRLGAPVVVVSLGTATVVDAVAADRRLLGGAIAAGVETGLQALAQKAAQLPRAAAAAPPGVIGRDTDECLQSGAVLGMSALVEGMIGRLREVIGETAPVALTGGHAELISEQLRCAHQVFPALTLEGLAAVWEHNRGRSDADR